MIILEDGNFKLTVSIIIKSGDEVLLQLRDQTGYMDGYWDLGVSGHVKNQEELRDAAVREAHEELNLEVVPEKLKFITMIQNVRDNYIYTYFLYDLPIDGEIKYRINEPNQIKGLFWSKLYSLPKNILPQNKVAIESYIHNIYYEKIYYEGGDR